MIRVLVRGILLMAGLGLLAVWLNSEGFFDRSTGELQPPEAENAQNSLQNQSQSGIVLKKYDDGHFYVDAWVNDDPVFFMIDTGASMVVLTRETANYLGFDLWDEEFDQTLKTVSGDEVKGARIILDEINIGDEVIARNVVAMVLMEGDMDLLGMSFLAKISGYSVEGDQMTLNP